MDTELLEVSILVRKNIRQQQINIDSERQVIAVKTTIHKPVNINSIYIPPHNPINDKILDKLIEQIPKSHILLGDLKKKKSTLYGACLKTNKKGTDLKKVINSNNLCILNNKSPTYLNPSKGSYLAIDITIWSSKLHWLHMEEP